MAKKAMLIDLNKCTGCRGCQVACKQWNELSAEKTTFFAGPGYQNPADLSASTWSLVKFMQEGVSWGGELSWSFRKHQCMHCSNAPCVENCPAEAAKRTTEGFTVFDQDACIGCGACVETCPFKVPHLTGPAGEENTKSVKCFFCVDRIKDGKIPACAKTCPSGAIEYGDQKELVGKAHRIAAKTKGSVYGETEMGGLSMIYALPKGKARDFNLVENPVARRVDIAMLKQIIRPFGAATLGAALIGLAIERIEKEG
ncbi:MAG: 4Fe-4S dicluster domain-containing protein [bacterium]|nr:4Fe-4S dicluster domain-containing protein [bacterium]